MRLLHIFWFFLFVQTLSAQEFLASVSVNTPQLQLVDPAVFQNFEKDVKEYMNTTKFTDLYFETYERIPITLQFNILKENSETDFEAEVLLQLSRPVYNSQYSSTLFNFKDGQLAFSYEPYKKIEFSVSVYTDQLSSVLNYYAYMMLGMYFDSFIPKGGEPYFKEAFTLVSSLPPVAAKISGGWTDGNSPNRFTMIDNWLSPRLDPFRLAWQKYHRDGLDVMYRDIEKGRTAIVEVLQTLRDLNRDYRGQMTIQLFVNAKFDELVEIFSPAPLRQRLAVQQIMNELDPSNPHRYKPLI